MSLRDNLEKKKVDAQTNFDKLDKERKKLLEQSKTLTQRIQQIASEQMMLKGEYRAIEDLLKSQDGSKSTKKKK